MNRKAQQTNGTKNPSATNAQRGRREIVHPRIPPTSSLCVPNFPSSHPHALPTSTKKRYVAAICRSKGGNKARARHRESQWQGEKPSFSTPGNPLG